MNMQQAFDALFEGKKVRLSDWIGYWFMTDKDKIQIVNGIKIACVDDIKVFTRDGDILDTPNFNRYKDRDDWEIVDEYIGWSFSEALRFMKNGKRVKRAFWNQPQFLDHVVMEHFGFYSFNNKGEKHLYAVGVSDLMADDWEIVN